MKKLKALNLIAVIALFAMVLTACGGPSNEPSTSPEGSEIPQNTTDLSTPDASETPEDEAPSTVLITDIHGEIEVPVNPEVVVALDNRTFETLWDWGVELAAAPKDVM